MKYVQIFLSKDYLDKKEYSPYIWICYIANNFWRDLFMNTFTNYYERITEEGRQVVMKNDKLYYYLKMKGKHRIRYNRKIREKSLKN